MAAFFVRPGREDPVAVAQRFGPKRGVFASGYFITDEIRSSGEGRKPYVTKLWAASRADAETVCLLLNHAVEHGAIIAQQPLPEAFEQRVQALLAQAAATRSLLPWKRG